ncbi:hypothetical protein CSPX01_15451 [Colletotrichum filicis]|nr:hypothetical protein CSPX01_15451 [Colletotrichum filicis]
MSQMQSEKEKHPELFKPDLNIDRRQCERVVPLEVLALGMSKTGTSSMQRALIILGYNDVYYGFIMVSNICEVEMWMEGMHAKQNPKSGQQPFGRTEFDQLLVVLVESDIESWYKSFDESIVTVAFNPVWRFLSWLRAKYVAEIDDITFTWLKYTFGAETRKEVPEKAHDGYRNHYATIRRETPPDRLLNLHLKDGWEPLCAFLGKPIPDVPFPHINAHEAYHEKLQIIIRKGAVAFARKALWVVVPGLIGVAAYYLGSREGLLASIAGISK